MMITTKVAFSKGNWFLADNKGTVGRILMIFSAGPHENLIMMKCWKSQPSDLDWIYYRVSRFHGVSANFALRVKQILANFGLFLPKCFGFSDGDFFPVVGNISRFQGSISNARRTFLATNSRQLTPTYNPLFWPKTSPGGFKNGSKDRLNLWTIFHIIPYSKPPPKTNIFLSSELFEFVRSRVPLF